MKIRDLNTKNIIETSSKVKIAKLLAIEIPDSGGVFEYHTDYFRDIWHNGITYKAGSVLSIGSVKQTKSLTAYTMPIVFSGVDTFQKDKALNSNSYKGLRVIIYNAYVSDIGAVLPYFDDGTLSMYFSGTVASVSIEDRATPTGIGTSRITWNCANEFTDFERVNGRITDDMSHRALVTDENGELVPSDSVKREAFKLDKGFQHANKTTDVLAQYMTVEKRQRLVSKKKGGLSGALGAKKYYLQDYYVEVQRDVDLSFDLSAKYIPVIYGVQRVSGIPVFIDTEVDNPQVVWMVYAFCEGEIEGFLDFSFDDKSVICLSSEEIGQRQCYGVKENQGNCIGILRDDISGGPTSATEGSTHGARYTFEDESGPIQVWTYHGLEGQTVAPVMKQIADRNGFKLQDGDATYWDDQCTLQNTAYAVMRFEMGDSRTELPSVAADIEGRKVINYDTEIPETNFTGVNPVWHLFDYLTNDVFGMGLALDRFDMDSFRNVSAITETIDTSYDMSWVPFWRYVGWKGRLTGDRRHLHQSNTKFETETTVFKNVDEFLGQFTMSLNLVQGLFTLTIENDDPDVAHLDYGGLIDGTITLNDRANTGKYNSVQASIIDPAVAWANNTITFYNSTYKREDNNVDKKAPLQFPYISNFYTARSLSEYVLNKSRYSKEITFTLPHYYDYLAIDDPITISYDRYGWDKLPLLITAITTDKNKITIVGKEYDRSIFVRTGQNDNSGNQKPVHSDIVLPPRELGYDPNIITSGDEVVGINGSLIWKPSLTAGVTYYQIFRSGSPTADIYQVTGTESPDEYLTYPVRNLPMGLYTFSIRAITFSGRSSAPATLDVNINPLKNLPMVENFRLVNTSNRSSNTFIGHDVELAWDPMDLPSVYGNISYKLYVEDDRDVDIRAIESTIETYTYTFEQNRADYLSSRGSTGFNRELTISIEAVSDIGGSSVTRVYL